VGKFNTAIGSELQKYIEVKENKIIFKGQILLLGAAHVRILPPQNLQFPFLQYRVDDLHCFLTLCKQCAITRSEKCSHNSTLRAMDSCWLISDLNKALELGYEILSWFELHYYEKSEFILKDYSKILFALKLQNSGFPSDLISDEQKLQYCKEINETMQFSNDFCLTLNNVCDNSAQKQLFKSMLNNFYGKFSQNSNYTQTIFINSHHQLMNLFKTNEVVSLFNVNEFNLQVEFRPLKISPNKLSCIYIGAQITSYARCIVYDYMMSLLNAGGKIYSVINDAIFYSLPKNVKDPLPFNNLCGSFKPVVPPSKKIIAYFALGNCNYSFLTQNPDGLLEQTLKVKGLTLTNLSNQNKVTIEMFENFIDEHFADNVKKIVIEQKKIKVDKEDKSFQMRFQNFTFDNDPHIKRFVPIVNSRIKTYPYGFLLKDLKLYRKRKLSEGNVNVAEKKAKFL